MVGNRGKMFLSFLKLSVLFDKKSIISVAHSTIKRLKTPRVSTFVVVAKL